MKLRICLLALASLLLTACYDAADPTAPFAKMPAEQVYQKGDVALTKGHYSQAIKAFEALSSGQKMLLRMGDDHAARVKQRLRSHHLFSLL